QCHGTTSGRQQRGGGLCHRERRAVKRQRTVLVPVERQQHARPIASEQDRCDLAGDGEDLAVQLDLLEAIARVQHLEQRPVVNEQQYAPVPGAERAAEGELESRGAVRQTELFAETRQLLGLGSEACAAEQLPTPSAGEGDV